VSKNPKKKDARITQGRQKAASSPVKEDLFREGAFAGSFFFGWFLNI
jgi:hypothetical protein